MSNSAIFWADSGYLSIWVQFQFLALATDLQSFSKGKKNVTFFFLNDLFLYLAIDTVFHPSEAIFQKFQSEILKNSALI